MLLIALGLLYSFGEGGLLACYFMCYLAMFLFWSWNFETRFLLPVAPLAFLYAWRGGSLLIRQAHLRRRLIGWSGFAVALAGCLCSMIWGRTVQHPQMRWCVTMWLLVGIASLVTAGSGNQSFQRVLRTLSFPLKKGSITGWQAVGGVVVGSFAIAGIALQIPIGLVNLHSDLASTSSYADIEAAEWINGHSQASSVIMARKDDIVYHYSQHRVIWFPASRDASLLMDGIRRNHVSYVVVRYGDDTYWRLSAEDCFAALAHAYPGVFRLVHTGPNNSVFEVMDIATRSS